MRLSKVIGLKAYTLGAEYVDTVDDVIIDVDSDRLARIYGLKLKKMSSEGQPVGVLYSKVHALKDIVLVR